MKNYIERRIRELKQEKDYYLEQMDLYKEDTYRQEYLRCLYRLDELYDLQLEMMKKYGASYGQE